MSWSDTKPGAIKSECLKSDYDLVFDNQQRLKDEFGAQHHFTTTGPSGTDGKHNGVSREHSTGSTASATLTTVHTTADLQTDLAEGNIFVLYLAASATTAGRAYAQIAIDKTAFPILGGVAMNRNYSSHLTPAQVHAFGGHNNDSIVGTYTTWNVSTNSDDGVIIVKLSSDGANAATYDVALVQLTNFGV